MTGGLRRAGRGRAPDGSLVVWTIADGRRGRRWREARVVDDRIISSLVLETDPSGRFAHVELGTAAGLLTLHPEADGTIHGNSVSADGVRHVVGLRWAPGSCLLVEGSPFAAAAATLELARTVEPGSVRTAGAVLVTPDLLPIPLALRIERRGDREWRLASEAIEVIVETDERGVPTLGGAAEWPLEVE